MRCYFCKKEVQRNLTLKELFLPRVIQSDFLCPFCLETFEFLKEKNCCITCQKQEIIGQCDDCIYWKSCYPKYDFKHESLFLYNEAMSDWFKEYKFQGNYCLRSTFADYLIEYFKNKKNDVIIPIPISINRMKKRQFNQVEGLLLAANISYNSYLIRTDNATSQVDKSKSERLTLVQPFLVEKKYRTDITNQSIILVDDIYTTGRTLFHAAEALLPYHPAKIRTFSLAR